MESTGELIQLRRRFLSKTLVTISLSVLLILSFTSLALPAIGPTVGGVNGVPLSGSWLARGTMGYTTAYSSMSDGQGKINSFYVMHVNAAYSVMNCIEMGWSWIQPQEGLAPLRFAVGVKDNDYYCININWFPAGTTHHYKVIYLQMGSDGQKWLCYWDGIYQCTQQHTWVVDGWSSVGNERTWNCGGNAEFTHLQRWNGSSWNWWTQANNWPYFDTDPSYRFVRRSNTEVWIRPG